MTTDSDGHLAVLLAKVEGPAALRAFETGYIFGTGGAAAPQLSPSGVAQGIKAAIHHASLEAEKTNR